MIIIGIMLIMVLTTTNKHNNTHKENTTWARAMFKTININNNTQSR